MLTAAFTAARLRWRPSCHFWAHHPPDLTGSATGVFDTLSDRLTSALSSLRGKGRLSDSDIALPVVRQFVAQIKQRAKGAEVSGALNPAQQVIKIVHEELIGILGGDTRRLEFAKIPPTVIMLAGLQGSGKTTLAGNLARL